MATVREIVTVIHRAIWNYKQIRKLELLGGAAPDDAEVIAQETALRVAIDELSTLLEVDP